MCVFQDTVWPQDSRYTQEDSCCFCCQPFCCKSPLVSVVSRPPVVRPYRTPPAQGAGPEVVLARSGGWRGGSATAAALEQAASGRPWEQARQHRGHQRDGGCGRVLHPRAHGRLRRAHLRRGSRHGRRHQRGPRVAPASGGAGHYKNPLTCSSTRRRFDDHLRRRRNVAITINIPETFTSCCCNIFLKMSRSSVETVGALRIVGNFKGRCLYRGIFISNIPRKLLGSRSKQARDR